MKLYLISLLSREMFSQQTNSSTKIQNIIHNIRVHLPFLPHFQQKYHTDCDPVLFNSSGILSPMSTVSGCSLQDGDYVFVLFIPSVFRKILKYSDVSFEIGKHVLNSMLLENNPRFLHSLRIRCTNRGYFAPRHAARRFERFLAAFSVRQRMWREFPFDLGVG